MVPGWDFTNGDDLLASYLSTDSIEGSASGMRPSSSSAATAQALDTVTSGPVGIGGARSWGPGSATGAIDGVAWMDTIQELTASFKPFPHFDEAQPARVCLVRPRPRLQLPSRRRGRRTKSVGSPFNPSQEERRARAYEDLGKVGLPPRALYRSRYSKYGGDGTRATLRRVHGILVGGEMMVDGHGRLMMVGAKPEIEGSCSGAPQGSGSRIFFGDPSDVGEIQAAVRCFRDGRHRATAGAVLSREEAARWEQIDRPRDLPDGFLRREAMAWSVALVSAEMSALAGMLEADERQLCAAETHCQVEQDAVNRQTSAALEEQIGHDLADGGQALQDALERMAQGADELFGDSGLSAEEGQGLARSSQDSEALQEIRTMIQAAWHEAGRLAAVGTEQWSEATQARARDRAAACRLELESVWSDVTTGMTDGRWRAKDDADGVEVLQSGLCATRDIGHGAERVRSLRELVGRTQVLCSHIWADRRVLEQLLRRCRMEVKRELECLRRDLQPGSLGAHEMLSTAPADGGSRSRVIQSSCDQGGAAARPASADRRLWRTWSLQASALYQLGLALVLLGMLLWQGFADLISGAAQVAAAGAAALCIGWWCYRATRMTGIVATVSQCIADSCGGLGVW